MAIRNWLQQLAGWKLFWLGFIIYTGVITLVLYGLKQFNINSREIQLVILLLPTGTVLAGRYFIRHNRQPLGWALIAGCVAVLLIIFIFF